MPLHIHMTMSSSYMMSHVYQHDRSSHLCESLQHPAMACVYQHDWSYIQRSSVVTDHSHVTHSLWPYDVIPHIQYDALISHSTIISYKSIAHSRDTIPRIPLDNMALSLSRAYQFVHIMFHYDVTYIYHQNLPSWPCHMSHILKISLLQCRLCEHPIINQFS